MFSLIIVIVSVVLVGLLAAASIYYLSSDDKRPSVQATATIEQSKQIYSALVLYRQDKGSLSSDFNALVPDYLSVIPTPPAGAYEQGESVAPADWFFKTTPTVGVAIDNKISQGVCSEINRIANRTTVIPVEPTSEFIVCYGDSAPYSFILNLQAAPGASPGIVPPDEVTQGPVIGTDFTVNPDTGVIEFITASPESDTPEIVDATAATVTPGFYSTQGSGAYTLQGASLSNLTEKVTALSTTVPHTEPTSDSVSLTFTQPAAGSVTLVARDAQDRPVAQSEVDVLNPPTNLALGTSIVPAAELETSTAVVRLNGQNIDPYRATAARIVSNGQIVPARLRITNVATPSTVSLLDLISSNSSSARFSVGPVKSGDYTAELIWPNGEIFPISGTITVNSAIVWEIPTIGSEDRVMVKLKGDGLAPYMTLCNQQIGVTQTCSGVDFSEVNATTPSGATQVGRMLRYSYREVNGIPEISGWIAAPNPALGPRTVKFYLRSPSSTSTVYSVRTVVLTPQVNPIPVQQSFQGAFLFSTIDTMSMSPSGQTMLFVNEGDGFYVSRRVSPGVWSLPSKITQDTTTASTNKFAQTPFLVNDTQAVALLYNPTGSGTEGVSSSSTNPKTWCLHFVDTTKTTAQNAFTYNASMLTSGQCLRTSSRTGSVQKGGAANPSLENVFYVGGDGMFRVNVQAGTLEYQAYSGLIGYLYANATGYTEPSGRTGAINDGGLGVAGALYLRTYGQTGQGNAFPIQTMPGGVDTSIYFRGTGARLFTAVGDGQYLAMVSGAMTGPALFDVQSRTAEMLPGLWWARNDFLTATMAPYGSDRKSLAILAGSTFYLWNDNPTPPAAGIPASPVDYKGQLTFSANSLDFGDMARDEFSEQTLTLSNVGQKSIGVGSVSITGSQGFSPSSNCPAVLNPSQSCEMVVSAKFDSTGAKSSTLVVTDSNASPITALLSADVQGANITATPSNLNFGNLPLNTTKQQEVQIQNTGLSAWTVELGLASLDSRYNVSHNCGSILAGGASCRLTVSATAKSTGTFENRVVTQGTSPNSTVSLIAVGQNQAAPDNSPLPETIYYIETPPGFDPLNFARGVDSDGEYVFVSAATKNTSGQFTHYLLAYAFTGTGYQLVGTTALNDTRGTAFNSIVASPTGDSFYGLSVVANNGLIYVSAPSENNGSPSGERHGRIFAYRFNPASNTFTEELDVSNTSQAYASFGVYTKMALDSGRLIAGYNAYINDLISYVNTGSGWVVEQVIPSGPGENSVIALKGNVLAMNRRQLVGPDEMFYLELYGLGAGTANKVQSFSRKRYGTFNANSGDVVKSESTTVNLEFSPDGLFLIKADPTAQVNGKNNAGFIEVYYFNGSRYVLAQEIAGQNSGQYLGSEATFLGANTLVLGDNIGRRLTAYSWNGSQFTSTASSVTRNKFGLYNSTNRNPTASSVSWVETIPNGTKAKRAAIWR